MFSISAKRSSGHPRKARYRALPFALHGEARWMIFDTHAARLVVKALHRKAARTLAHTLNVADLCAPLIDYGGDP
jgi:hypothetical protein